MLTRLDLRGVTDVASALGAVPEPSISGDVVAAVREVIAAVRARGDAAVREYTARFDGCEPRELRVPPSELKAALDAAAPALRSALELARDRITRYHEAQAATTSGFTFGGPGEWIRELVVPVDRAGCYVPGGRASYPSSVLMTVIPARVAGVPEVALCVPPGPDGRLTPATLAAAALAGADEVYAAGGAQAIAALAYGTESIGRVDMVVGPGNIYVACAKREVAGVVGIDGFAGPSEVVVVADESANPSWVAADLLAQAEHGPGGRAILVTWHDELAAAVDDAISRLLTDAPRRAEIESTLATGGAAVVVDGPAMAMRVVNEVAPEHVELCTVDPGALVPSVRNAGAVFLGPHAPAVLGDYLAGVNHVLPTARTARFASALRVDHFRKHVHIVDFDHNALARLAPSLRTLAEAEGLAEHARSVELRQKCTT